MYVSDYFQSIPYDADTNIAWHAVFGSPMLIARPLANLLHLTHELTDEDLANIADDGPTGILDALKKAHILIDSPIQEVDDIEGLHTQHHHEYHSKVRTLSLVMSEECNFRCKYCMHFANAHHATTAARDAKARISMPYDLATRSIDLYMDHMANTDAESAHIHFGGGEPLLNWQTLKPLLRDIDDWRSVMPIRVTLSTNLALLTPKIAKALIEHDVEVEASLDGHRLGNDAVRQTKRQTGTYNQILDGFDTMAKAGRPIERFTMTVTEDNFKDVNRALVAWAAKRGIKEIRINPDIIGNIRIHIPDLVNALIDVRNYAKTKGVNVTGFWARPAENMGLNPYQDDIAFCDSERGGTLSVVPSGEVFPCNYSNYQLGHYEEIGTIQYNSSYRALISGRKLLHLHPECLDCEILGFCRGGCMITDEYNVTDTKRQYLCEFYRTITRALLHERF